jgi:hypothetical protein
MGLDVRTSRRTKYIRCLYFSNQYSKQEVLERVVEPIGVFYAERVGDITESKDEFQNMIRRDRQSFSIKTSDETIVKVDDWVLLEGEVFIVDNVSYKEEHKIEQFSSRPIKTYTIGVRK